MRESYFMGSGMHQALMDRLIDLLPGSGPVELHRQYVALEKLRQALHCYYDLHNNGLANKAREAHKIFGFGSAPFKVAEGKFDQIYLGRVELRMDEFVTKAATEQGWIPADR
jgi:hypothetical protein